MKRERFACNKCPAFYECGKGNISATAGGWEKKNIDGQELICCIPREAAGAFKAMKQYGFYCLATPRGKLIANKADYTGNVPLWCPRLEAEA
jgi:hypothetical protein